MSHAGGAEPARFVDMTSAGPARLFGIAARGGIARRLRRRSDGRRSEAAAQRSPTTGAPRAAAGRLMRAGGDRLAGRRRSSAAGGVMWEGDCRSGEGRPVRFLETLAREAPAGAMGRRQELIARPSKRNAKCRHARCRSGSGHSGPKLASPSAGRGAPMSTIPLPGRA